MSNRISLSPAANAVWEAFNEDEAGVFVDYGNKLAAALRAAALHCVPDDSEGHWVYVPNLLAIADELDQ